MKTKQFTDAFIARNFRAFGILSNTVAAMQSNDTGINYDSVCGCELLDLELQFDALERQFEHLLETSEQLPAVPAIQALRRLHLKTVGALLAPWQAGASPSEAMASARGEVLAIEESLKEDNNFPQPEEVCCLPAGVLRIWDPFIWKNPKPWSETEASLDALIHRVEESYSAGGTNQLNYPYVAQALGLLKVLREVIRPTEGSIPEVDMQRLFDDTVLPPGTDVLKAEELEIAGNPS